MGKDKLEARQPWVTCFLTGLLVTHMEETIKGKKGVDYARLFRGIDGFETPADPATFLKDASNWVPLSVLRELLFHCEKLSGKKDIAYQIAKANFDPRKKQLPSLFEIVARVLNDVRSVLICGDLWASVQMNYLRLQSFEKHGTGSGLYMLSQFDENARPTVGAMYLLRGLPKDFRVSIPLSRTCNALRKLHNCG